MNLDLGLIVKALDRMTAALQKGPWEYANTILVGLTLLVLIWYTIETSRLRKVAQKQTEATAKLLSEAQRQNEVASKLHQTAQDQYVVTANLLTEAQRQNEVAVMPVLVVYLDLSNKEARLVLQNVGSGPAFNVRIDRHSWGGTTLDFVWPTTFITSGQSYDLMLRLEEGKAGSNLSVGEFFQRANRQLPESLDLRVHCISLHVTPYEYVFKCRWNPNLTITFDRSVTAVNLA